MTDATTPEQPLDGVMLGAIRYRAGEGHGQSVEDRAWLLRFIERRAIEAQARPAVASEGLVPAWRAYSDRFMDPANRDSPTAIRDAFAAGWDAALASDAGSVGALDGLDRALLDEHHKEHKQDECWCPCLRIAIAVAYDAERQGEGTLTIPAIQAILDEAQQ